MPMYAEVQQLQQLTFDTCAAYNNRMRDPNHPHKPVLPLEIAREFKACPERVARPRTRHAQQPWEQLLLRTGFDR